jgi:hypothetical protein
MKPMKAMTAMETVEAVNGAIVAVAVAVLVGSYIIRHDRQ